MQRSELIHAMEDAYGHKSDMGDSLDVAVGELLPDPTAMDYGRELDAVENNWDWDHQSLRCAITQNKVRQMVRDAVCIWWTNRRSLYLKPKSDPAVEALRKLIGEMPRSLRIEDAEEIVSIVRKADAK